MAATTETTDRRSAVPTALRKTLISYWDYEGFLHIGATLCPEVNGSTGAALTVAQTLHVMHDAHVRGETPPLCPRCAAKLEGLLIGRGLLSS